MAKLTRRQRIRARNRAAQAALLAYRNRGRVHYTQGSRRWSGISGRRNSAQGEFPYYADCSAFATWCLWNALYLPYRRPDVVNGHQWRAGYTGTQIAHGRRIGPSTMRRGDLVFYAVRGSTPTHVAICVGRPNDRPMVVSHGNESGPLYLPWNYRRVVQVRRYIRDGI
jgi:cell wall-associated NlpC family hydrolase